MNVLGHPYAAWRVFRDFSVNHIMGSWLPDLVPFVPDSVFEFEEIHEGGEKFLRFLDENYPDKRGLALGMLAHGYNYGADDFSSWIEKKYESNKRDVVKQIIRSTPNLAGDDRALNGRFHNFLWWGVDVQILKNEGVFMGCLNENLGMIQISGVASLLAECFDKEFPEVERMLHCLLDVVMVGNVSSVDGLVKIWQRMAGGLPERDEVDVVKCVEAFEFCAGVVVDDWREIVDEVCDKVQSNLRKFV